MATPMTKTTEQTSHSMVPEQDNRMPSGIAFIVGNEFAERFCFYGINAILTVYMTKYLRFGDANATTWHSLFKTGAYFFPLIGAVISDVFWGKFRTIMTFSLAYVAGCAVLALWPGKAGLLFGLFLVAFGTGGIKPCVSTNVGDQFTAKNQHLIERAFSYFYLAINAGSSISIYLCPILLNKYGPKLAFGMPAAMMLVATLIMWLGRDQYAHVPPAGKAWFDEIFSVEGIRLILRLLSVYLFVACFWALWDQSNGQTWTLQAESSLMDKNLGFGFVLLPAQVQVVNGLMILALVPIFTFGIYPLMGKFFAVTPLRKMGIGFFVTASSFLVVGYIEKHIQAGQVISVWWQILAYLIVTAGEVLVSITALEFSYKQAPLRVKSFIMALFLLSVSAGNAMTAYVNHAMVKPLDAVAVEAGADTWVKLSKVTGFVLGQKIDLANTGLTFHQDKEAKPLEGTFLVAAIDPIQSRVKLMDAIDRKPVASEGTYNSSKAQISTYKLVGPEYFHFFAMLMAAMGVLFIFVALAYKEKVHVRTP